MRPPPPVLVADLFAPTLDALLELLASLPAEAWLMPTADPDWTIQDIALHLLGGDVGILSRQRDGFRAATAPVNTWDELVAWLNEWNDRWMSATRRMSPRLVTELLRFTGDQVTAYFRSRDPFALGDAVSWAGPEPAPVWLDLAREYTERWHHQQQIRDAAGRHGLTEPRFLSPVLAAFVHGLPRAFREVEAAEGTLVALTITGDAGGRWFLLREPPGWSLYVDAEEEPAAEATLDEDTAWRLFSKGLTPADAAGTAALRGDRTLAAHVLKTVSVIA